MFKCLVFPIAVLIGIGCSNSEGRKATIAQLSQPKPQVDNDTLLCDPNRKPSIETKYLNNYIAIEYVGNATWYWPDIFLFDDTGKIRVLSKFNRIGVPPHPDYREREIIELLKQKHWMYIDWKEFLYITTDNYNSLAGFIGSYNNYDTGKIDYQKCSPYKITVFENGNAIVHFVFSTFDRSQGGKTKIDGYFKGIIACLKKNNCNKATVAVLESHFKYHY